MSVLPYGTTVDGPTLSHLAEQARKRKQEESERVVAKLKEVYIESIERELVKAAQLGQGHISIGVSNLISGEREYSTSDKTKAADLAVDEIHSRDGIVVLINHPRIEPNAIIRVVWDTKEYTPFPGYIRYKGREE